MRFAILLPLTLSAVALAHGGAEHLKGEVVALDAARLTLSTQATERVTVGLDAATRFERDGKPATAKDLRIGARAVVHVKAGSTPPVAAVVKFASAPAPAVRVEVAVTPDGFVVAKPPTLKAGVPVTLVVTRTVETTCATDIVIKEHGLSAPLPLRKPVEVSFTPKKAGKVRFACPMDMIAGELVVE